MPTKRTRRTRGKQHNVSTAAWYFLNDALHELPTNEFDGFETIGLEYSTHPHIELSELWKVNRNSILKRWLISKPGTRPHCWWLFDAPALPEDQHGRYADTFISEALKEPRKRLSGVGTPCNEVLNVVPHFKYGVPEYWMMPFQAEYCSGKAKNINAVIDSNDPPIFESQACYLDRFGLLSAEEKKKSDFTPESVIDIIGTFNQTKGI